MVKLAEGAEGEAQRQRRSRPAQPGNDLHPADPDEYPGRHQFSDAQAQVAPAQSLPGCLCHVIGSHCGQPNHRACGATARRRSPGVSPVLGTTRASHFPAQRAYGVDMTSIDLRAQIREFLRTRRARITPAEAGLTAYGGNRRVSGLRREEVAMLAGVSVDYYVRMERGSLAGVSDRVLASLADALRLDDAERDHLEALARESGASGTPAASARRSRAGTPVVRPGIRQVLDAITDAPAWVRNGRHDILAMNPLARALYAPVLADPRRPPNTRRFVYLYPAAAGLLLVDFDLGAKHAAAMLRLEAGRSPHDHELIQLVGELSTRSELFRQRWASQDVRYHRSGRKRLRHPIVGQLDLDYEALELPNEPGLVLNIYTAAVGTPASDALKILASWVADQDQLATERAPAKA